MKNQRNPETTKKAILDAAEKVFLKKGFGAAAISDIAREAGITKSLIHHYFGSKRALWSDVKNARFREFFQSQMKMLQQSDISVDLMKDSFQDFFTFLSENPEITRILSWMFLERDFDESTDLDQQLITAGKAKFSESQDMGMLRSDIDTRFMLLIFINLALSWFQHRDHFINDFGIDGLSHDIDKAFMEAAQKIFFEGVLKR